MESTTTLFDKLLLPISAIVLPQKIYGKLRTAGIYIIFDLAKATPEQLSLIAGINNLAIYEIGLRLDELGLSQPLSFSHQKFRLYAEQKGIVISELFKRGHALSNPELISQAKEELFEDLPVSARAKNAIKQTKAKTLGEVLALRKSDLSGLKNCGTATQEEIGSALEHYLGALMNKSEFDETHEDKALSHQAPKVPREQSALIIQELPISRRSKNALIRGGIRTVSDLLSKTPEDLLSLEGLGAASLDDIKLAIAVLSGDITKAPAGALTSQKPKIALPDAILSLKVTELPFTSRALGGFERSNIRTVADLIKLRKDDLMAIQGLGATTVKDILNIREGLKAPEVSKPITNPITSIEEALALVKKVFAASDFTSDAKQNERIRNILLSRFPGDIRNKKTFEGLAREFRLTRERVRQLESRGLKSIGTRLGRAFWQHMRAFVAELLKSDGIKHCGCSRLLQSEFEFRLYIELAKEVSGLVHFDFEESIWLAKDEEDILSKLKRHFERASEKGEILGETEIKKSIKTFCSKSGLNDDWEKYLFNKAQKKRFGEERELYAVGAPRRGAVMEILVQKHFPCGISPTNKKDAEKFLAVYQQSEFADSIKKPLGTLRAALNDRERFVLWGRGTYVARTTISVDRKVLKLAEEQIDKRFEADVMCVGVFGVFEEIKAEAILAGIPNPYALYSCLRLWTDGKYRLFKYPFIYPRHHKKRIIGATRHSIESYLRDQSGPLPASAVADQLGLKEYQVINVVQESPVLLRCSNSKCIHIDNLNTGKAAERILETILADIKERLEKFDHISVRQVYDDNRVSLVKIGIQDSTCLYSFLSRKYGDIFDCPRLPYIVKHGLLEKDARVNAQALVEEYFKDKTGPVYISDLVKHFSEDRGYPATLFESLPFYCEGFLRYTTGAFISKSAISWTQEKQKNLKTLAISKFEQNSQMGVPYVIIDELLEMELPIINEANQEIYWQKKLLADILDEIDGIEIIGSLESVYVCVPNKHNIENTDDLICHILKTEFSGAANRLEFQKRLLELGIVKNISGSSEKYRIENEEISLIKC